MRGEGVTGLAGTIMGRFSVRLHQEVTLGLVVAGRASRRDFLAAFGEIPSGRYPIQSDR